MYTINPFTLSISGADCHLQLFSLPCTLRGVLGAVEGFPGPSEGHVQQLYLGRLCEHYEQKCGQAKPGHHLQLLANLAEPGRKTLLGQPGLLQAFKGKRVKSQ